MQTKTKILNWAIFGTGRIANRFVDSFKFLDKEVSDLNKVYAVASRKLETAKSFAEKYNIDNFEIYQNLVKDPKIDIVYIASPHNIHYQDIKLCLEHGKHVLCEKPITTSFKELQELTALAKSKSLFLMEAMKTPLTPLYDEFSKILSSGVLGEITYLRAEAARKMPYHDASRLFKTELAGGALLDVGVYGLFLSLFLAKSLGLSFKPELLKVNSHFSKEDKVDLSNDILLRFGENLNVNLFSSISHNLTREAYIGGTKGFIKIEDFIAPTKMQLNLYKDINFDINGYDLETKDYDFQLQGSALQYNVIHISDCFSKGLTESPIMSHSMSLELQALLEEVQG
ncbi:MAG: Gfo/Idh/MocA family oxidoreductase [Candidatus Caenarcaniphilales bacterium]|nr:Gfo/Idh/MocA family oxidoreductase [Candidatus Caenarcaniphilales bacterium]